MEQRSRLRISPLRLGRLRRTATGSHARVGRGRILLARLSPPSGVGGYGETRFEHEALLDFDRAGRSAPRL